MDESASRNLYHAGRLRGALERDEFRLCYDDFGTGYSSLSDLRRFPIQRLKIDRSFVGGVTTHPDDAALTFAIIAMAQSLHLDVVAEGVETPEQAAFLREHGCGALQDFLFSRAVAAEEFERFLERAKPLESDLTLDLE